MRGSSQKGRFDTQFEMGSIHRGISEDLGRSVGQTVEWYRFDPDASEVDEVYSVGSDTGGRKWKFPPIILPTVSCWILQDQVVQNERGYYNSDTLVLSVNVKEIDELLPGLRSNPDPYYKDRIVYNGEVFTPTRLYLRGNVLNDWTMFTINADQVKDDQLVNDEQFSDYSS